MKLFSLDFYRAMVAMWSFPLTLALFRIFDFMGRRLYNEIWVWLLVLVAIIFIYGLIAHSVVTTRHLQAGKTYYIIVRQTQDSLGIHPIEDWPYLAAGVTYVEYYATEEMAWGACDRLNDFHDKENFVVREILYVPC